MQPVHRKKKHCKLLLSGVANLGIQELFNDFSKTTINLFSGTFTIAFSALTLTDEHHEEHLACKKVMRCWLAWLSVWSKVQVICI